MARAPRDEEEVDYGRSPSEEPPEEKAQSQLRRRWCPKTTAEGAPSAASAATTSAAPPQAAPPPPAAAAASPAAEGLPSATKGPSTGDSGGREAGGGRDAKKGPAMSDIQKWGPYEIVGPWQWHPKFIEERDPPKIVVPEAVFHYKKALSNRDLRKLMASMAQRVNLWMISEEGKADWKTWKDMWHARATQQECESWLKTWLDARGVPIKKTVPLANLVLSNSTVSPGHIFSGKVLQVPRTALQQPLQQNVKATHSCLSSWKVVVLDREPAWWMLTDSGQPSDFLLGWHGTNAMALSHILCCGRLFPSEIDHNDPKKLFSCQSGKYNVAHGRGIYATTDFECAASFSTPCVLGLPEGGVGAVAHPERGEPLRAARDLAAKQRPPPPPRRHTSKKRAAKQAEGAPSASQAPAPPPPGKHSGEWAEGLPSAPTAPACGKAVGAGGGLGVGGGSGGRQTEHRRGGVPEHANIHSGVPVCAFARLPRRHRGPNDGLGIIRHRQESKEVA